MIRVTRNSKDITRIVGAVENLTKIINGYIPRDECGGLRGACSTMICNKITKLETALLTRSEKSDKRWEEILRHMQQASDFMFETRRRVNDIGAAEPIKYNGDK